MLYFIIAIGIILQALFIKVEHDEKYVAADILKGSAALMFVIVGFLGMKKGLNPGFADKIFTGLVFGMIGDILLNLRFVFEKQGQKIFLAGIAAFLIGHIMYLVALIPYAKHLVIDIILPAPQHCLADVWQTHQQRPERLQLSQQDHRGMPSGRGNDGGVQKGRIRKGRVQATHLRHLHTLFRNQIKQKYYGQVWTHRLPSGAFVLKKLFQRKV